MSSDTIEVRVLLRRYWRKGLSTRATADEINDVEKAADLNRSMKLKKRVKSSLIRSRMSGTSNRSGTWWTDDRKL